MVTDVKITSETKVVAEKLSKLLAKRNLTHREVADQIVIMSKHRIARVTTHVQLHK